MSDILLINPWCSVSWVGEPLGLEYIAAVLEENGFRVKILDLHSILMSKKEFENFLKKEHPSIVGISTHTPSFSNSLKIAKTIKDVDSSILNVLGGPHATFTSKEILLKNKNIDVIIRKEGEYAFKEISDFTINGKGNIEKIRGITIRKKSGIKVNPDRELIKNLDELPFPARHLLFGFPDLYNEIFDKTYKSLDEFFKEKDLEYPRKLRTPNISIIAGRGCPFHCSFCASTTLGKEYRMRSIENIKEEIFHCIEKYNVKYIDFVDDTFVVYKNRLEQMCLFLKEYLPDKIYWCCNGRINLMDKNSLKNMAQSGCDNITYGIESADVKILKHMNKKIKLKNIKPVIENTVKENMSVYLSFIIGYPTETTNDIRRTINFAENMLEISELVFVSFNPWTPMIGAPIYQMKEKLKMEYLYDDEFRYPGFTAFKTPYLNSIDIWKIFRFKLFFDYRKNVDIDKRVNIVSSIDNYDNPILVNSCIDIPLEDKIAVRSIDSKSFLVLNPFARTLWPYLMNGYYTVDDIVKSFKNVSRNKIMKTLNRMAELKIIGVDIWSSDTK